jgi:hypothetical protein
LAIKVKAAAGAGWIWVATVLTSALIVFPLATLLLLNRSDSREIRWIHELIVRKNALAATEARTPRVLISGGSNALFGIDASLIEKKLGIPAINTATHAALGLDYLLDFTKRVARRGDTVVLPLEWEQYRSARGQWSEHLAGYVWSYEPGYLLRVPPREALRQLFLTPLAEYSASISRLHRSMTGEYYEALYRKGGYDWLQLSRNGDLQPHSYEPSPVRARGQPPEKVDKTVAATLRKAVHWARDNDVRLIFDWPNTVAYDEAPPDFVARQKMLASFLRSLEVPLLDDPADHFFPAEFFLDTQYHLNPTGRRIRTERLIQRLRPLLQMPEAPTASTSIFAMAGDRHGVNEGNVFAKDAGVQFRRITKEVPRHPDTLTVEQLIALHRAGTAVLCSDDETHTLLEDAGLKFREVAQRPEPLADWLRDYPDHLFLIARSGTAEWKMSNLPTDLTPVFEGSGARVAVFGTGRFHGIHLHERGNDGAQLEKPVFQSFGAIKLPIDLRLKSSEAFGSIVANGVGLTAREPGLAVLVIDPVQQIIARAGIFPPEGDFIAWRLWRSDPSVPPLQP